MTMETLFARPVEVPAGFENDSVYVFYLEDEGGKGAPAANMGQIRIGAAPQPGGAVAGGRFRSNLVLTRLKADRPLAALLADMRKQTLEAAPNLKLVQEGPTTVAKQSAHQSEYAASVQDPPMQFVQWHVTTIRDGFAYTFHCTCEKGRWAADKPRFESFIGAWK